MLETPPETLAPGRFCLDPAGGVDEIERVVVVLLDAGGDGQDVGIEDDVVRVEADFIDEDAVGALADADFLLITRGLAVFIEGHHHHRRAVAHDVAGRCLKILLAFLERDRVDDALALQALQAGLEDLPLRGIHHDRHLGDIRLALQQVQEAGHHRLAVDQAVVEADIDDVGAVGDLLAGDLDGGLEIAGADQLGELRRAGDIGALADHQEALCPEVWL